MKKCSKCGFVCEDSCNFCPKCGSSELETCESAETKKDDALKPAAPSKHRFGKSGILAAAVIVLTILVTILLNGSNPVNKAMNALKNGDSVTAVQVYQDKIAHDAKKSASFRESFLEFVNQTQQEYEDEKISFEAASNRLSAASELPVESETVYMAMNHISEIKWARDLYQTGLSLMDDQKYDLAINAFGQLTGSYTDYNDKAKEKLDEANSLYLKQVKTEYEELKNEGGSKLQEAYDLLTGSQYILNDNEEINSMLTECASLIDDWELQTAIEEIDSCVNSSDFESALDLLETAEYDHGEEAMKSERGKVESEYAVYAKNTSLEAAKNGEFVKAYNLVTSALDRIDDSELKELQEIYCSHIPVLLGEMELFKDKSQGGSWGTSTYEIDQSDMDTYNNEYAHSVSIGTGFVSYLLNYKYDRLTGTVACPKGTEADNYRKSVDLVFYGNGNEILRFKEITPDTKPQAIDLDVSAYERLSIEVECTGLNIWSDWGYFATIYDAQLIPITLDLPAE